jgi:hypothetical protein
MDQSKLRRADLFSGGVIILFGLWVVLQALQMPMKGSWGGVQNVWFVSPALFPLFVGAMIVLLGALLVRTAYRAVGRAGFAEVVRWIGSVEFVGYLGTAPVIRFYAMVVLFFSYVFLAIPRVDFFLASVLFVLAFITMFYFDDDGALRRLLFAYLAVSAMLFGFFAAGLAQHLDPFVPHAADWLTLGLLASYGVYAWRLARGNALLRRKYRVALVLAVAAPFTIGLAFKYLLLVPMPKEGLIALTLDALWYWDF